MLCVFDLHTICGILCKVLPLARLKLTKSPTRKRNPTNVANEIETIKVDADDRAPRAPLFSI